MDQKKLRKLIRESIYLVERNLEDVSLEELNPKQIADDWLMSGSDYLYDLYRMEAANGETSLDYDEAQRVEGMDNDEIDETEDFKYWLEGEVQYKFDEAVNRISQEATVENGRITLWREMTVPENYIEHLLKQGKHLGIYWSFTGDAAEAHWAGQHKHVVIIETSVEEKYINWEETILANMSPTTGEDEKEIRLFRNTPLKIEGLQISDYGSGRKDYEFVDITPFENKIFLA